MGSLWTPCSESGRSSAPAALSGERFVGRRVGERAYAIFEDGHDTVLRFLTLEGETALQSDLRVLCRAAPGAAGTAQAGGR